MSVMFNKYTFGRKITKKSKGLDGNSILKIPDHVQIEENSDNFNKIPVIYVK